MQTSGTLLAVAVGLISFERDQICKNIYRIHNSFVDVFFEQLRTSIYRNPFFFL